MKPSRFWPSSIYFLFFAAISALVPYLALYYREAGLVGGQIGMLLSVTPIVTILASPLWTGLADVRRWHRWILIGALASAVSINAFFPLLSPAWFFPAVALFAMLSAPIMPLVDSATFAMLGDQPERYGRLRIWGTIGWGLCAPLAGALLHQNGLRWGFWIYALILSLALLPASRLTFNQARSGIAFLGGLRSLLTDRRWVLFLLTTFTAGIGLSAASNYLALLMESRGGSQALTGVALTVSVLAELPIMFFSYKFLPRLKTRGLFLLAVAVTGLRSLLYAVIAAPIGIIAVQLLHGFTFPALWVAGVTYSSENAPPGLNATAQGIFGSTLMGFGAAAGSLLGGFLMERMSPAAMFGVLGIVVLTGLACFLLLERFLLRRQAAVGPA